MSMVKKVNRGFTLARPKQNASASQLSGYVTVNTNQGVLLLCAVEELFDMETCKRTKEVRPLRSQELHVVDLMQDIMRDQSEGAVQ